MDGVPVFWLEVPAPLRAMLVFRVGQVDETLPTHGITHLVEHLAMYPLMQNLEAANRINARVEPFRTRFMASGTPEEIATFLADVTTSLTNLPLDRLENEKKVLRTEAANRTGGSLKAAWSWRFGAAGPGLLDFDELGLRWLGPEPINQWAQDRFTAGNAVLWLSGPVPENLKLNLRPGTRKPLPELSQLPSKTPAVYQQGDRWVLLSMLGARGSALAVGTRILDGRLRERLRHQQSLAYEVNASYQRLNSELAEITSFADSLAPSAREAAGALVELARSLAESGPTAQELSAVLAERRRMNEHPEAPLARLEQVAMEELEGLEPKTVAELDAEADALTPGEIAAAFKASFPTSYLSLPREIPMTVEGFTPVPASSGARIKGVRVDPMPGSGHSDVIDFSTEGISLMQPNRTVIGMRWPEVAVALWWSDGRRTLIGPDGSGINIIPAKWRSVESLLAAIRQWVPADRWIPMDEPGTLPRQEGPICAICESTPAIEVTFQDTRSLLMIWFKRVHGVLCRDCGIAKFREVQRRVLVRGWWSIPGLLATPIALLYNTVVYFRFKRIAVPIHSSGITPLPKGRTVWLDPGMLIPAGLALALIWIFWPR
ncbi:MAG: insulinase family protein [Chloroflexi bacterium]|nr:MAG: insulinase family protein [Chloroflexota bacterium]